MNMFKVLRSILQPPKGSSDFTPVLTDMGRFGNHHQLDVNGHNQQAISLALTSSWVSSDIRLIADRVSSDSAEFEVKQGEEEIDDHPIEMLFHRPNSLMSGIFLKRSLCWWYWLTGNAYLYVATPAPGRGEPLEIYPLVASLMRPLPDTLREGVGVFKGRQLIDFEYNVNGGLVRLYGEQVIHFRTPNPVDYWEGLSPLTAGLLPIQMDRAQGEWQREFFDENNAVPSAIISVPATTSVQDFERQRTLIREQLAAGQKRLFTRSGDLSVSLITQTLEQMQVLESRRFNQEEIDRVFGVPQGFYNATSGDSRIAAEVAFSRNTIQPMLDYMAEELTANLAPFYGEDVKVCAPNVIPQDRALEVQEYSVYSLDRTINENRLERGLEPHVDETGLADIPVRLLQYLAPSLIAPVSPPPSSQPPTDPNADQPMDAPEVGNMLGQQDPEAMIGDQYDKAVQQDLRRWERVALKELRAGRNPSGRIFRSTFIPEERRRHIQTLLQMASEESEVKAAFQSVPFRCFDPDAEDLY